MPPVRIRADYDVLRRIATQFDQEAQKTLKTIRALDQAANTLRQGDWIGKGAKKFYREFDAAILPSMNRLRRALVNAGQTTKRIADVIQQAEDLAARLLGAIAGAGGSGAGAGQTAPAAGGDGAAVQQIPEEATEARLNENGITIQSSGNCRDRNNASCTSLDGMRQDTVDGLIEFRNAVGVDLVMTGGTEVGHAAGQYSHANGYKVDISLNPTVNRYIEDNFTHIGQRSDGAELYQDANGNEFAREGNHWDITFY